MDVHRLGHPGGDPGDPGPLPAARLAQGAHWLEADEREALEDELTPRRQRHRQGHGTQHPRGPRQAFRHPKVLLLAAAYFFVVTDQLRRRDLPAQDPGEVVRRCNLNDADLGRDHPAAGRAGRPAPGRLELGPHRRAPAARLGADLPGRRRAGRHAGDPRPRCRSTRG